MLNQPTRVYAPQPQAPVQPAYGAPTQPPVMRPMPQLPPQAMGMMRPQMPPQAMGQPQRPSIMPLMQGQGMGGGRPFGMNANVRQF